MTRYSVQRYCARNDTNGNPRRVFVIRDEAGVIVATADEGYAGRPVVCPVLEALGVDDGLMPMLKERHGPFWAWRHPDVTDLGDVDVAPGVYRRMVRWTVTKP
jgi:hypothetical protein